MLAEHLPRLPQARVEAKLPLRPTRLTLDQLRIFSAVAAREHLTGAAKALRLSQGSVSAQVRRLEQALGLPLLHRVGRNVRLTDVGRAVHRQALDVLESARAIEELATGYLHEDQGEICVVAGLVIGAHRLSGWLAPFVREHPRIDVRISIARMPAAIEALASGAADVVILGAAVNGLGLETMSLERTELVVVVSAEHPLASASNPLHQLGAYRYLAHEQGSATQTQASRILGNFADLSPAVQLEEGALLAALHTGLGFAVMPRAIVQADIDEGRLAVLPRRGKAVNVAFTAVRRAGLHTPVVDSFWAHLKASIQG